jgi:hypothetical protein
VLAIRSKYKSPCHCRPVMICNLHQKSTWCKDRYQVEFKISLIKVQFYEICTYLLYYKGRCLSVCQHLNVQTLTSPPILKLWDTQGYLWLSSDLTEVIKLIGVTFRQKKIFFQKNTLCHSFRISVIPSVVLSFFPDYCHSFQISVISSEYCHSFQIITISNICQPE